MPVTTADRRAFDQFLEHTRRDVFSMYEAVRAVQRGDGPVTERLDALNELAAKAWDVYAAIAELNAAVWFPEEVPSMAARERVPELRPLVPIA
jgi:hypothetical protein